MSKRSSPKSQIDELLAAFRQHESERRRLARSLSEAVRGTRVHSTPPMANIRITPISEQIRDILEPRWEEERRANGEAAKRSRRWNIAALVIAVLALLVSILGTFDLV